MLVVTREDQLLLRSLPVRLIVNGNSIYPLVKGRSVAIRLPQSVAQVVVSDGFHMTRPIALDFTQNRTRRLQVGCVLNDNLLVAGALLLLLFYVVGWSSDLLYLSLLSFVPVLAFLYLYYIRRSQFFQLRELV